MYKRLKGFTLAEVLITLGIVGVVAAITLPNLIANYQKKAVANRLKKMYAITKQAVKLSTVENDDVSGWDFNLAEKDIYTFASQYFAPYFRGSQIYPGTQFCQVTKNKYSIKNLANKTIATPCSNGYAIIVLLDGSYFITKEKHNTGYEWLYIDINGLSGPNRVAKDIFVLNMTPDYYINNKKNAEIVFWMEGSNRDTLTNSGPENEEENRGYYGCSKKNKYGYYSGYACGALIQLDGWKISKDYPW